MFTSSQRVALRKIADAIVKDDEAGAVKALEDYAKLRAARFLSWADSTPHNLIPEWKTNGELYDTFCEFEK